MFFKLLSYMKACSTYFHEGYDMFEQLKDFMKHLDAEILKLHLATSKMEKQLGNRHNMVNKFDSLLTPMQTFFPETGIQMEGYLFKRASNAFKTWNRRWFYLNNNQLLYRKRTGMFILIS